MSGLKRIDCWQRILAVPTSDAAMVDLLPGVLVLVVISYLAFIYGKRSAKRLRYWQKMSLVMVSILMIVIFRVFVEERLWVARVLPISGVLTCVAWSPVFASLAIGVGWDLLSTKQWRRVLAGCLLVGISTFASLRTIFDRPAVSQFNYKSDGWTLQTTQASCSPSSAVNLLKEYGIQSNESEMVDLCLTTYRGTTRLGLYRGLKLKLAGTQYFPRPIWGGVEDLLNRTAPAIIFVELKSAEGVDPRYTGKWGWTVGLKHVVVYVGRDPIKQDEVRIIDPAVGMENWNIDSLRVLFQGEGVEIADSVDAIAH